jgi:capsular polysaccharide biosynthesis protein
VSNPDPAPIWHNGIGDDLPELLWDDDLTAVEDRSSAALPGGLISLAFITAALKRRAWVWCLAGVLGLMVGSGLYVKDPPAFHASVSVLLVDETADAAVQVVNDQAIASSQAVAALVVQQLGLHQSVASFQAASSVTVVSDNVLSFNVGAPSANDAVVRVTALATEFLKYRAQYAAAQEQQQKTVLDQEASQAQKRLDAINAQIGQIPANPSSAAQQAQLANLQTQREAQNSIEAYVTNAETVTRTEVQAEAQGSIILGVPTSIPRSHLKGEAFYVVAGLVGGVAVGIAIVVIAELMSDRLRRRDDVAEAIGAPVRLSLGPLRSRPLLPLPGRATQRRRDMLRIVAHLRGMVPGRSRSTVGMVVVAVDNAQDVAPAVVSLAVSCAQDGRKVVFADLAGGALARRLGVKGPGIHPVTAGGESMVVAVPDRGDITPTGPLQTLPPQQAAASEALLAAYGSADLVFTLATLDPAFGGDHLATWATDAVAIVTSGRSSGERVHAVGEMIRLAGVRLDSVVLIEAEKTDESLGATLTPEASPQVRLN